jgi:hypothetical protein
MEKKEKPAAQKESRYGGPASAADRSDSLKKALAFLVKKLDSQIRNQDARLDEIEKKIDKSEENLKFLTRKLVEAGCIKAGERRRVLKRNTITQEALIGLLDKKKVISKKALVGEIRRQIGQLSQKGNGNPKRS